MSIGDEQVDNMIEIYEKLTKRADLFYAQAQAAKAFVDAHVKAGFTRVEAIAIFNSGAQVLKAQ